MACGLGGAGTSGAVDRSMPERGKPADASDVLRETIFGDAPVDRWVAQGADHPGEPWDSFEHARQLVQAGHQDEAVTIWQRIADTEGLESRHTLQAWHFLRQAGHAPPADLASVVFGVTAEIPIQTGHDLLAAYKDGTAATLTTQARP
jgi:hypothetical protein